jgi:type II secretory pathway pseudopilin PulG
MPDRMAAQLEKAIAQQTVLVEEVRTLQVSKRRMEAIIALLLVILVLVGGLAQWSRQAATQANQASRLAKEQVAATAAATAQTTRTTCQIRNGGFASVRDAFTAQYQALEEVLANSPNPAATQNLLTKLRASIPAPEKQDIDCDRDGKLGPGDYPPPSVAN